MPDSLNLRGLVVGLYWGSIESEEPLRIQPEWNRCPDENFERRNVEPGCQYVRIPPEMWRNGWDLPLTTPICRNFHILTAGDGRVGIAALRRKVSPLDYHILDTSDPTLQLMPTVGVNYSE